MDKNSTNNSESDKPESVAEAQPEDELPPNQMPGPAEPVAGPSGLQQNVQEKVSERLFII